ncbi:MAG: PDZ domain-containing protein [Candidatus Eremiobacteraeota bacterium]|nr:PDZ domain-containing protein [Candidatus Eremiobacteraeota bacterium]MBV8366639.1 PDZ domain-containing protein [Candidatus Eremiobacteraeota bacterium]
MTEHKAEHPPRIRLLWAALVGVGISLALFYIPLPFLVFGPGDAIDLNGVVHVPGHSPPPGTLYLTDVKVMPGRPAFYVAGKLLPGFEVVPRVEYAGDANDVQFDRELEDAMTQSQQVAQVVAERAAGLPVKTLTTVTIAEVRKGMPAANCFQARDTIVTVDAKPPDGPDAIARAAASKPVGSQFTFEIERAGERLTVTCRTAFARGKPLFGIVVSSHTHIVSLPVHVTYDVKDINGSSAGLMFALQIYRTLRGHALAGGKKIAGTGVLAADGSVLPVGGAIEKLRAAIGQGATVFLVPKADFPAVSGTRGATILPVRSFDDALRQLDGLNVVRAL